MSIPTNSLLNFSRSSNQKQTILYTNNKFPNFTENKINSFSRETVFKDLNS